MARESSRPGALMEGVVEASGECRKLAFWVAIGQRVE